MCHYADNQFYSVEKSQLSRLKSSSVHINRTLKYLFEFFGEEWETDGAKKSKISSGFYDLPMIIMKLINFLCVHSECAPSQFDETVPLWVSFSLIEWDKIKLTQNTQHQLIPAPVENIWRTLLNAMSHGENVMMNNNYIIIQFGDNFENRLAFQLFKIVCVQFIDKTKSAIVQSVTHAQSHREYCAVCGVWWQKSTNWHTHAILSTSR